MSTIIEKLEKLPWVERAFINGLIDGKDQYAVQTKPGVLIRTLTHRISGKKLQEPINVALPVYTITLWCDGFIVSEGEETNIGAWYASACLVDMPDENYPRHNMLIIPTSAGRFTWNYDKSVCIGPQYMKLMPAVEVPNDDEWVAAFNILAIYMQQARYESSDFHQYTIATIWAVENGLVDRALVE